MKILHVIDNLGLGGAQFMVKGYVEYVQDKENHIVFSLRRSDSLINIDHPNIIYSTAKNRYSIFPLLELKRIIKKEKIDILHCYLQKSQMLGWLVKLLFYPGLKFIFHELGSIAVNNSYAYKFYMRRASKKVNIYLAASNGTKKMLINKIGISPEKIIALYNFIDLDSFKKDKISIKPADEKKKLGIESQETVIGYAGRLHKVKGCEYLVRAIPHVKSKIKVLIAGIGQEYEKLTGIVKELGVEDKIIFLGFVKNMPNVYSLYDILVIPSENESFGLIAIEAQSMGIPVIASNVPGLNEVVVDNESGLQFEARNPQHLAEIIDTMISNSELQHALIKGGIENANKYSIESYADKLKSIYHQL